MANASGTWIFVHVPLCYCPKLYEKYLENTDRIEAFYAKVLEDTETLCIKMREYSIDYAGSILSSDKSNDDKYDDFDELYDCIYEDAGDEIYDGIYDGILDDMYDDFYDGILDEAYDDAPYDEWSTLDPMNIIGGLIPVPMCTMNGLISVLMFTTFGLTRL